MTFQKGIKKPLSWYDPNRPPLQEKAEPNMTSAQYLRALEKLDLSQVRAARFFGISDKHSQRMARGETEITPSIAYTLKLMLRYGVAPGELDRRFK